MNDTRTKYLIKNTLIFTLENIATKFISFILIPLYTNVLSTAEYGTIDLVSTISTLVIPIITLNISEAVMRFNLDKDSDEDEVTKIGITILGAGALVCLAIIPISNKLVTLSNWSNLIYFYVIFMASCQLFLADLRGKEMLIQYSFGNILNTLLIAIFNIIFLVVLKWGIDGYLISFILSAIIVSVYAFIVGNDFKAVKKCIDYKKMKEMLKFSVVLIPNSFMWWIMNSLDHIMVTTMIGVGANGIYAISYKLPTLISVVSSIFMQAWQYSAIRESGAEDESKYTNSVFNKIVGINMIIGIVIMAIVKPFLRMYTSLDYYDAWRYTPFLIIGSVYLSLASFMSTTYTVHKDSSGFLLSGSVGAGLNVLLNFALIPCAGIYGAAIATCISYVAVFIFRLFHTRKYIRYNIQTYEFVMGSIFLVISMCLTFFDRFLARSLQFILIGITCKMFKKIWFPFVNELIKKIGNRKNG